MAETTVEIAGLSDLNALLQTLPGKLEQNILRGALRAGQRVIQKDAQGRVPVLTGDLRKSIRVSVRARAGKVTATVKAGNKKAWYAHLVEFGTAAHMEKPVKDKAMNVGGNPREVVHHPGAQPKPFMRPAFDGKGMDAITAVADYIKGRLEKEQAKALDTPDNAR